jgi:predicted TPR repeat methyltransferase
MERLIIPDRHPFCRSTHSCLLAFRPRPDEWMRNLGNKKKGAQSSPEVVAARKYSDQPELLQAFWQERYQCVYAELFDDKSEFGRYGVIAEYIQRLCPDSPLLDIGCGTGLLSMFLSNAVNYCGIDLSDSAIKIAKRRFPARRFLCTDVRDFTSSREFKIIVFNESLYYLNSTDVHKILKRVAAWTIYPHLIIMSFYSENKEAQETFDIFSTYVSIIDGVRVEKMDGLHSWSVVCGFLND